MTVIKDKKNIFWILAGVAAMALILIASRMSGPPDPYLTHAPPPGKDARPDPPNPGKAARLPGAAAPMAAPDPGPAAVEATQVK